MSNVRQHAYRSSMLSRLRFPALTFFGASFFGLLQLYYSIGGNGWRLSIASLVYGFVIGLAIQLCFHESLPRRRVALAAFAGSFLLWVPVVLVTYGLALMATPIFMAYAVAVVLGTIAASSIQRRWKPSNVA
jgi:hypothetical protein